MMNFSAFLSGTLVRGIVQKEKGTSSHLAKSLRYSTVGPGSRFTEVEKRNRKDFFLVGVQRLFAYCEPQRFH